MEQTVFYFFLKKNLFYCIFCVDITTVNFSSVIKFVIKSLTNIFSLVIMDGMDYLDVSNVHTYTTNNYKKANRGKREVATTLKVDH